MIYPDRGVTSFTSNGSAVAVVVLTTGQGTRMKFDAPEMLHAIGDRVMLGHALCVAENANPDEIVVVVDHQREKIIDTIGTWASDTEHSDGAIVVHQGEQSGTSYTVQYALKHPGLQNFDGATLVTISDVPLLDSEALQALLEEYSRKSRATMTVLTSTIDSPHGYDHIIRNADGEVLHIMGEKDASDGECEVIEAGSGIYAFDAGTLTDALRRLDANSAQGGLHLTDIIGIVYEAGRLVRGHRLVDATIVAGVDDRIQPAALSRELSHRTCEAAMYEDATIVDPGTTRIDAEVGTGYDVTTLLGTQLYGRTVIGGGATVGPNMALTNMVVGKRAGVVRAHDSDSEIDEDATVGPFTYIRLNAKLGVGMELGGFAEVKNAQIRDSSKVPHLTYVGDAETGGHSSVGAFNMFMNYNSVSKYRTVIGSHVRTDSDTIFIAPVTVGDGAHSGAGIIIKNGVSPGALTVSGGRQCNIEG